ncbi:hypothetical protein G6F68_021310 [Rhizopus microsporus]|nr:hypothetical protein G6F68_021310 [Rhizopus microsporus]
MASDRASRTRLSFIGFLSVPWMPVEGSAYWSSAKNTTRTDGVSSTYSFLSPLSLGRASVGGSSIMSTSPANSAATRAAALLIGL